MNKTDTKRLFEEFKKLISDRDKSVEEKWKWVEDKIDLSYIARGYSRN